MSRDKRFDPMGPSEEKRETIGYKAQYGELSVFIPHTGDPFLFPNYNARGYVEVPAREALPAWVGGFDSTETTQVRVHRFQRHELRDGETSRYIYTEVGLSPVIV